MYIYVERTTQTHAIREELNEFWKAAARQQQQHQ